MKKLLAILITAVMILPLAVVFENSVDDDFSLSGSDLNSITLSDDSNAEFIKKITEDYSKMTMISISDIMVSNGILVYGASETTLDSSTHIVTIENEEELNKLSNLVNGTDSHNFSGYTIILTSNIVMSETSSFTPIGKDVATPFSGTFDGQGYTISNLKIADNTQYIGLFGCVNSPSIQDFTASVVKNIGLINSVINVDSEVAILVGSIAGWNGGTITNCYSTGDVTVTASYTTRAGGIVGWNDGLVESCYNSGNIDVTSTYNICSGGIAGWNNKTIQNCYNTGDVTSSAIELDIVSSGGIAGRNRDGITDCYNLGDVAAFGLYDMYAGGIAGYDRGTILNCYNMGMVEAESSGSNTYSGGIVGQNRGTILNSYNAGNITSSSESSVAYAGGIGGADYHAILNCYNTGDITASSYAGAYVGGITGVNHEVIENSYNTGNVEAESKTNEIFVGGIVGQNNESIINCYNTGNISVHIDSNTAAFGAYVGGIAGESGEEEINDVRIINCYNIGNVTAVGPQSSYMAAGGIAAANAGLVLNCYNIENTVESNAYLCSAGGIIGWNLGTIQNCYNSGNVKAVSESTLSCAYSGGIAGHNLGVIQGCRNIGEIESYTSGTTIVFAYSGGIVGYSRGGKLIENCYNIGNVTATSTGAGEIYSCSGGIVGYNSNGGVLHCYNVGDVTTSSIGGEYLYSSAGGIVGGNGGGIISYCYNVSDVTSTALEESGLAGGIVGEDRDNTVTNSFYANEKINRGIGNIENGSSGTIGLSEREVREKMLDLFSVSLDGTKIWSSDIFGLNNGYPVLADVPLSLNNSELKSPVYILVGTEKEQVDNFLNLSYAGNLTIKAVITDLENNFKIKYQWYVYDEESSTFEEINNETRDVFELPYGVNFNTYCVKVTFSNGIDEYTYTSFTRTIQHMDECYVVQFDMDVTVVDSNGNVISPVNGIYLLENGKYTYSAVVDGKTIKNSFTVSSSDKFIFVEENNTLYYVLAGIAAILIVIAAFYFIKKKK